MKTKILQDGDESFKVLVHESGEKNSPVVLFSVGSGGMPERYSTLLNTLKKSGCTIVAPCFEQLTNHFPNKDELSLRARRLSFSLKACTQPPAKVIGVGHSIGAATLIALAGAEMQTRSREIVDILPDNRLMSLVILAAPTQFFYAPGSLDTVNIPIFAWVGSEDDITPSTQTEWLAQTIPDSKMVKVRVVEGVDHFSFMDQAPPHIAEPKIDKNKFLREYSEAISKFALSQKYITD
ncbi:hypothetical protein EA004_08150 [Vibrio anguillarum]|uniref:Alpha/beta hydrolase n=1 Tax=Vibrio anguillarum TaxID=55601 RepID=A0ABR9Z0I7_VIBAN|nr:hypothetical protein [Vibrio anguillarum]MBF4245014.1 hypothetical protein [Vibrio anguillarum]MBF4371968.1 hypothetical protein [Vibrio anguillarum]